MIQIALMPQMPLIPRMTRIETASRQMPCSRHIWPLLSTRSADTPRGVLLPSADEDSYSEHSFAETDDDREAQAIDAALDSLDALIRG